MAGQRGYLGIHPPTPPGTLIGLGKVCVPEALGVVKGYSEGISVPKKGRTLRNSYRSILGAPGVSRAGFAFTKPKEVTGGVPAQDLMML